MRLSYKWLSEYVDLSGITPEELAEKMTTAGLEVEGIEPMAQGTNLVIGEVVECEDIPETHLHATVTRIGPDPEDVTKIVCGAPNCRKGLKVIAALPGAELPGGTITAKPLRGYESNGMLCALYELGVDKKNLTEYQLSGIEELPADAPVGERNVFEYLGLDDTILDVSLTPNRADCSAMWNMAKEVGAILHREVRWPDYEGKADVGTPTSFRVASNTEKCPAFTGKVVNHVKVGPSPKWMVNYLHAAGMNSINNVVDISNFVMLETGQPLHYYNLAKLPAGDITVVDDRELTMTALDGEQFDIKKGDLLITTGGEATGIAGIMGGEESMIDETTEGIFIEAANFNAVSIRRTSIRLNLITEAAQRFTKGIEPLSMKKAVDRSVQLLEKYADASGFEETILCGDHSYQPVVVKESKLCNEPGALLFAFYSAFGTDIPVFLRDKVINFSFSVNNHPGCDTLDASGGQSFLYFPPEKRADFIPDKAVQRPARLLRVDPAHIELSRIFDRCLYGLLCNLIEFDTASAGLIHAKHVEQMPADRFPLTVRVCCEIDLRCVLRFLADTAQDIAAPADRDILQVIIMINVHAKLTLGKIADMPLGSFHLVSFSKILADRFCLRRRLNNDQFLFCISHISHSSQEWFIASGYIFCRAWLRSGP